MKEKTAVELAVIADDGFMIPSIVMLTSAKINKKETSSYIVHFFCVNVNSFYRERLLVLSSEDFRIIIHDADTSKYKDVSISIHVTSSTFLKLDLAQLLPNVDKVLHIDGDALIFSDLTELFEIDITKHPLAVVRAMSLEQNGEMLKRTGVERGFNAGIMLMNLKRWREMHATHELCSMLQKAPKEWIYLEQDCMNVFFHDNSKYIPLKYNLFSYVLQGRKFTIEQVNNFYGTNYANYAEMCNDSVILHLAGTPKRRPWEVINGVHGNVWQYYYNMSPLKHHYFERGIYGIPASQPTKVLVKEANFSPIQTFLMYGNYQKLVKLYRMEQIKSLFSLGSKREKCNEKKKKLRTLITACRKLQREVFNDFIK